MPKKRKSKIIVVIGPSISNKSQAHNRREILLEKQRKYALRLEKIEEKLDKIQLELDVLEENWDLKDQDPANAESASLSK